MNILITGYSGFVGSHLCEYLAKKNNIIGVARKINKKKDYKIIQLDLSREINEQKCIKFFKKNKIDAIIHLASSLANNHNISKFELFENNIKITKNVIKIIKIIKPKNFINFSSMSIYPDSNGLFNENYTFKPNSNTDFLYGFSKYCSEILFNNFYNISKKINLTHLRVAQIYGERMNQSRIIPTMKRELKQKNFITVFGNGSRISNFIHINKLVRYIEFILTKNIKGVFNIGDKNISYLKLAKNIIIEKGNKNSIIIKKKEGKKNKFLLDTKKFDTVLKKHGYK